jgi:hypothetical protein
MVKNTATTIPTPQNTTPHLLRLQATPIHTPGPPFETHTSKTFRKLALHGICHNDSNPLKTTRIHPIAHTEPRDTSHTDFPRKIPNYTPTGRYQHTHWGARAPKQRVRPPHHPAHHKRPTNPETDRAFSLSNHRNPTQTDAPRLTPSYHRPLRLLHSHREHTSLTHPPPVSPHIPLISPILK